MGKLFSSVALIAFALPMLGCQQTPTGPKLELCWDPETKISVQNISSSIAFESMEILSNTKWTDATKEEIKNRTRISVSDFYVIKKDEKSESLECGAQFSFNLTGKDGAPYQGTADIQFNIYKSEHGALFSVQRGPITSMLSRILK